MSDVVGIFFGGYVELLADRMGLPQARYELIWLPPEVLVHKTGTTSAQTFIFFLKPKFSPAEADSMYARVAKNGGQGRKYL